MSIFPAADLTWMRTMAETAMPESGVIYAITYTSDGAGGVTLTSTAVTSGTVACRLDPSTSNDLVVSGRESLVNMYRLTLPHDAPLAADNQVVISTVTYEVVSLIDDNSWPVVRRALVAVIQ